MRCFVHHDQEAVGICLACGKGLCPDCVADLGHAISCRGACEQTAREMHAQNIRSQAILNAQKSNRFLMPAFFIVIGAVWGWFTFRANDPFNFGTVSGALFFIWGLVLFMRQRRLYKDIDRNLSK
ncbi:MAG: DUF2180 family protein [Burkholderiaceae bacterium]|jgi:hypothetical protein|nr:DUF2180 family protein [Burkholderiaceae bacterium]